MHRLALPSLILSLAVLATLPAPALTNNLALTPPMGWNSWNNFSCSVSDPLIRTVADAMATNGMKAAGYQFVNIDDCWQVDRDQYGVIEAGTNFPGGMKALADYVHGQGLKLGIYTDHGTATCQGRPGTYSHEYQDADTYASWGVDYVKDDNCNLPTSDSPRSDYARMSEALRKCGRPITFSLCFWEFKSWEPVLGNLWRTTGDIGDSYASMISKLDENSRTAYLAGPGRWNDPDMLEVGRGGMTATEDQAHFSLWCIMAAPLIAGNDVRHMSPETRAILTNPEVVAVDQDPMGEQGVKVVNNVTADSTTEVWSKTLGDDFTTKAVVLFNRNGAATDIPCRWTDLGLRTGTATVRDLWARKDLGTFTDTYTPHVAPHTAMMLKVTGTAPALPVPGTNYLSDLQSIYAYVGWGQMHKDKSIGGHPITLDENTYDKGLGVHAFSGLEYDLGGKATRFQATIGIDDEVGDGPGSVVFQVFADGKQIFDSGVMHTHTAPRPISLNVSGVKRLVLGVNDADDGNNSDHADWADAQVLVPEGNPAQ